MSHVATSRPATARLKALGDDRYKVICDARDIENRPCQAPLGTIIRERDLREELASQGGSEALATYAGMDIAGWSDEHFAIDNVPLPGPSWRILPPLSDPRDPTSDRVFRKVDDGVYAPVSLPTQYVGRSRRKPPGSLSPNRGHYPEPSTVIVCPKCRCRVAVKAASLEALRQPDQ